MIYLGSDHAGFNLKEEIKKYLSRLGIDYDDLGNLNYEEDDDYPDFSYKVAQSVANDKEGLGIIVCGSSLGACVVANKVRGVRAVSVRTVTEARISREHNDANVLCLAGGGTIAKIRGVALNLNKTKQIIKTWLNTTMSEEKRHHRRVNQIKKLEELLWKKS